MDVDYTGTRSSAGETPQCRVRLWIVRTSALGDCESRVTVCREDEQEHLDSIGESSRVKKRVALAVTKEEHPKNYSAA